MSNPGLIWISGPVNVPVPVPVPERPERSSNASSARFFSGTGTGTGTFTDPISGGVAGERPPTAEALPVSARVLPASLLRPPRRAARYFTSSVTGVLQSAAPVLVTER